MNRWTWHLARSLFRFAGKSAATEPEPPPDLPPPERGAPAVVVPPPETDLALLQACEELRARSMQGVRQLESIPDGDWRQFADAVSRSDGALHAALDNVTAMRAESAAGLRAKAEAMQAVLDGASEDAELATRIARSLITDALAVLPPGGRSARNLIEEPGHGV